MLSWLIPVATIYPPGAMVVELEARQISQKFNVSVIPQSGKLSHHDPNFAYLLPSIELADVGDDMNLYVFPPPSIPTNQMDGLSEDNMTGQYFYM